MPRQFPVRRVGGLLTSAALLATMSAATVTSPASAAKPKCQGKTATIVGTKKGEVIRGTTKRDIIVAKGGHDRIYGRGGNDIICAGGGNDLVYGGPGADRLWGQLGRDRLNGNAGPDFLAGQVGNDTLAGGIGMDTCFQGTGTGKVSTCERPMQPVPAPVVQPVPEPPPEPPTLVIAYGDVNTNGIYDDGDVLVAKIVDTKTNGTIDAGDTVKMGRYPTSPLVVKPAQLRSHYEDWLVKEHPVVEVVTWDANRVSIRTGPDCFAFWYSNPSSGESFQEGYGTYGEPGGIKSTFLDEHQPGAVDAVITALSPSNPIDPNLDSDIAAEGDDGFIDVDIVAP